MGHHYHWVQQLGYGCLQGNLAWTNVSQDWGQGVWLRVSPGYPAALVLERKVFLCCVAFVDPANSNTAPAYCSRGPLMFAFILIFDWATSSRLRGTSKDRSFNAIGGTPPDTAQVSLCFLRITESLHSCLSKPFWSVRWEWRCNYLFMNEIKKSHINKLCESIFQKIRWQKLVDILEMLWFLYCDCLFF